MQKIKDNTLQEFLNKVIENLKIKNVTLLAKDTIDIPFTISTLYQNFQNHTNRYKDFIEDLKKYPNYNIIIHDNRDNYDMSEAIIIYIYLTNKQFYPSYKIDFICDNRYYGFCECTPDMPDYREDKHCCGHGCDAVFYQFNLYKILPCTSGFWEGDEHDYWNFEDEFYLNDKELAKKKEKENREREIEELKNKIKSDQKRLAELENI